MLYGWLAGGTSAKCIRSALWTAETPRSLLIVTTGNIQNRDLLAMFERHPDVIGEYLTGSPLVELSRNRLVAHSSNDTEK